MSEYTIAWGGPPEDLRMTARGVVTVELIEAFTREALADPRYRPGLLVLIDYRDADLSGMTQADVDRRLAMMARDGSLFAGNRLAIVVARAVDYGVMRMLHQRGDVLFDTAGLDVERRIFDSMDEARAWLAALRADALSAG